MKQYKTEIAYKLTLLGINKGLSHSTSDLWIDKISLVFSYRRNSTSDIVYSWVADLSYQLMNLWVGIVGSFPDYIESHWKEKRINLLYKVWNLMTVLIR